MALTANYPGLRNTDPGVGETLETEVGEIQWGNSPYVLVHNINRNFRISGGARDLGNVGDGNTYRGPLNDTAALTAILIASLAAGDTYNVDGQLYTWSPTAISGAFEPDDKVSPGTEPGYWVTNAKQQHILRPGLALAWHDAQQLVVPYDSTAAAAEGGTLLGFLAREISAIQANSPTPQTISVVYRGNVKHARIKLNEGTPGPLLGHATEAAFRAALAGRFLLDDFFKNA